MVAELIAHGNVIGWFQGAMEFGPRALGNRSILGDSRDPQMQTKMNLKIKYRESFRPFAPSVLAEKKSDWFDLNTESPYMLLVAPVKDTQRLTANNDNGSAGISASCDKAIAHSGSYPRGLFGAYSDGQAPG